MDLLRRQSKNFFAGPIVENKALPGIDAGNQGRNCVRDLPQPEFIFARGVKGVTEVLVANFCRRHSRQIAQRRQIPVTKASRHGVDQTKRPDLVAIRTLERHAGVEPDAGPARHQRIVGKTRVFAGIFDDKRALVQNRVATKRDAARRLGGLKPLPRFEPLALMVNQRHQRRFYAKQSDGQASQAVKTFLRRTVEQSQVLQLVHARRLVRGL